MIALVMAGACSVVAAGAFAQQTRGRRAPKALGKKRADAGAASKPQESAEGPADTPDAGAPAPDPAMDVLTMVRTRIDDGPRAIGTCDPAQRGGPLRFGLAHVNDLHARYGELVGGRSRYAYVAGYLRQLKAERPTLVVDAGDDYEKGSIAEYRSGGETTRQMVQALPIDVRSLGGHDLAYGEAAVMRDLRLTKHPIVAANLKHLGLSPSKQPFRGFARFDVGCVKVGVIGLVPRDYGADDDPTDEPYFGVIAEDARYQAVLERESRAHRGEVDVLIAVAHLGLENEVALARGGGRLVDIIIGGHEQEGLDDPTPVFHPNDTRTWIVEADRFGRTIGRGEVVVYPADKSGRRKVAIEKYELVDVNEKLPAADDVAALATRLEEAVTPDARRAIGRVNSAVKKGRPMAELAYKAASAAWKIDTLILGRDAFRSGLPKGEITLQRLYDAATVERQPAGTNGVSSIWVVELSGADLRALARTFGAPETHDWIGSRSKADPARRYRVDLDKGAALSPRDVFGASGASLVRGAAYAGELVDALEPYVRGRTEKGLTID